LIERKKEGEERVETRDEYRWTGGKGERNFSRKYKKKKG
jgi:hypothetical protein